MTPTEQAAEWEALARQLDEHCQKSEAHLNVMRTRADFARHRARELRGEMLPIEGAS